MDFKKLLIILSLLFPLTTFAVFPIAVPFNATSTTQGWIFPLKINGTEQTVVGNNFLATSTTATNVFNGTVLIPSNTQLQFRDSGQRIHSFNTNELLVSAAVLELQGSTVAVLNTSGQTGFSFVVGSATTNYLQYTDAGTGVNPQFAAIGTDSNIGINLVPKGSGAIQANGNAIYYATGPDVAIADGGTNASSFAVSNSLVYYNGTSLVSTSTNPLYVDRITATSTIASVLPYASTTALSATSLCLTGDLPCKTSWPTGGGSGVGTVSTSSTPTRGNLSYWTSSGAWPETLGTVATTSLTATSPLSLSQAISVIGGSASALSLGTVGVANGGTGQTSFGQGWFHSDGTTITASTSPTVNYLTATSSSATSTFPRLSVTSQLRIPSAADPSVSQAGDLGVNTTQASTSLRYHDGTAERSVGPFIYPSAIYASSSLAYDGAYSSTATTTYLLANYFRPVTLVDLYCKSDTGTARVEIGTGTASSTLVCSTTGVQSTTNVAFTMRQNYRISIGTQTGNPNRLTVSAVVRIDAD